MEERKLIRLGNSSFAIALPKTWVSKSGLKKGDKVYIVPNSGGEIIVSAEFKKNINDKEIILNLENKDEAEIVRDLISAYISGYKTISVLGDKDKITITKQMAKNFLNLELVEETEKKAVFRDLLDLEDIKIENFIKRMDNNLKDMFSILIELAKTNKGTNEKLKELNEIDKDVTKFYFLIWRFMNLGINNPALQTSLKINPSAFIEFFWFSYNMEQIGDELKRISRRIIKIKGEKESFLQILSLISDSYNKCIKSFSEKDKDTAKQIILKKQEIIKLLEKLSENKGFEIIAEKLHQINANINNNSKMIFYNL